MEWVNPPWPPRLMVCYLTWKLEFFSNILSVVAALMVWCNKKTKQKKKKKKKKHTQNNMAETVSSQNQKLSFYGSVFYT